MSLHSNTPTSRPRRKGRAASGGASSPVKAPRREHRDGGELSGKAAFDTDALLKNAWQDRDLGWLAFNRRVLHEALDERTPLLERLKFLAIVTSNLDEFFMKRISLLRGAALVQDRDDPMMRRGDARTRLAALRAIVVDMLKVQAECYHKLVAELSRQGVVIAKWAQLTPAQRDEASAYFDSHVSPALTPLGFDPAHPFPFMSNLSTNWAFVIRTEDSSETHMVRVKIPHELPAWVGIKVDVPPGEYRCISLEELICENAAKLLPGMTIVSSSLFRILRNAQVELEDDEGESLRDAVTDVLRQRRFEPVVRVDFGPGTDRAVRRSLIERFELDDLDVYESPEMLDYPDLFQIAGLDIPSLRDPSWTPQPVARLRDIDGDVFAALDSGDLLVHHPYESFDSSVEQFIHQAADDARTVAIKMTVYRVGDDTPFVRPLVRTAESGKQVACVIELTARFDEARNLHWAQQLEKVGAHVTYGVMGLKTHAKIALVVLQHGGGLRCYAHIGTGNYHVKTARLYTDVGLLTADPEITADVVNLFHYLTGYSKGPRFAKLLVAPMNMRQRFLEMIHREIAHAQAGRAGRIVAKMNQVDDIEVITALSAASKAGVRIDLIVRGFCCLRPGVPGWSDNVRVRSIIGRFLEHSRIFYFGNGADDPLDGDFYIGSADWMFRNLSHRVEAAVPIQGRPLRERLWEILEACLQDQRQAWEMQPDGTYVQRQPVEGTIGPALIGTHAWMMESTRRRTAAS